jgi:hypothetical protein
MRYSAQAGAVPTMAGNPSVGPTISRAQILQSAFAWLAKDPPYSQTGYYPGIFDPKTQYRRDCSGFVSMAWDVYVNTNSSNTVGGYVTWTIPSIAVQLPSDAYLLPGDVLDFTTHHVVLFTGWVDQAKGTFSYIAQTEPGLNMQMVDTESVKSGTISGWPYSDYKPYRYENVVDPPSSGVRGDWNSNGTVDLLARNSSDNLWFYEGSGTGVLRYGRAAPIATGYSQYVDLARSQALVGQRRAPDLVGIDGSGTLWLMAGTGYGSFFPRVQIGAGWTGMKVLAPGDMNGDGFNDLLGVTPTGALMMYPGTGGVNFRAPVQIGRGWGALTPVSVGDMNGDGRPDIVATTATGAMNLYRGNGRGGLLSGVPIGRGWTGYRVVGPGDFNLDGHQDLVAIDPAGDLWLYPGTGTGALGARRLLTTSWGAMTLY